MKVAKISINTDIGEADFFAQMLGAEATSFCSADMSKFLDENADATDIEVTISSNGGSVTQGFEIFDLLKNCGKNVKTIAYKANSIATVIFLAGSTREITKNASFVIHNPFIQPSSLGYDGLDADALTAIANDIRDCENKIFNLYNDVLQLADADKIAVKELMKADTDLTSEKALKYGFATAIINGTNTTASNQNIGTYTDKIAAYLIDKKTNKNMDINKILAKVDELQLSIKKVFKAQNLDDNGEPIVVQNSSSTADDGTVLYYAESALAVGIAIFADEAMTTPIANGTYTVDGSEIVITDGFVYEMEANVAAKLSALEAENTDLKTQLEAATTAQADVVNQLKDLAIEVVALKATIPSDFKDLKDLKKPTELSPAQKQNLFRKEMLNLGKNVQVN